MKRRSLGQMILLTIVTLGIYQIFWLYNTKQEMNSLGQKVPPFKLLMAPLIALVLIALAQFIVHFVLNTVSGGTGGSAIVNLLSFIVGVVAALVIIPVTIYWMIKYCEAIEVVTNHDLGFGVTFLLWLFLGLFSVGFIWPFIIQNSFNKVADLTSEPFDPGAPVTSTPPTNPPAALVQ